MKKMVQLLKKKKSSCVTSYNVASDAVPEAPRDIPRYFPKPSELQSNFHNDACISGYDRDPEGSANGESNQSRELNSADELTIDPTDRTDTITNSSISDHEDSSPRLSNEILVSENVLPVQPAGQTSPIAHNALDHQSSIPIDKSDLSNILAARDKDLLNGLVAEKNGEEKRHGNTYVITISNSRHFHIGSKKTVNYPSLEDDSKGIKPKIMEITSLKALNFSQNKKLDNRSKLTENDVLQISLSVQDKWREFARNLGTDEATIQELEDLNDKDYNLTVYDILQQYLSRYPDTTVGFMVSVLEKSNENKAVRKLLENH